MWKWSELKALLKKKEEATAPDYSEYAAVMWPASYPYQGNERYHPEEPHCTAVYFGKISDLEYTKDDVLRALRLDQFVPDGLYLGTTVAGLDWFGPDKDVPVLRLEHTSLQKFRAAIVTALNNRGIFWIENYPEYKPHVSIPRDAALEGVYPSKIILRPVELWWGPEHIKV